MFNTDIRRWETSRPGTIHSCADRIVLHQNTGTDADETRTAWLLLHREPEAVSDHYVLSDKFAWTMVQIEIEIIR